MQKKKKIKPPDDVDRTIHWILSLILPKRGKLRSDDSTSELKIAPDLPLCVRSTGQRIAMESMEVNVHSFLSDVRVDNPTLCWSKVSVKFIGRSTKYMIQGYPGDQKSSKLKSMKSTGTCR